MDINKVKLKIAKEIEKSGNEIVKFAQELIRLKSENPYSPEQSSRISEPIEKETARLIFNKLKKFGFKPRFVSSLVNRPNVVCSLKETGKPVLIFNGHMDTVSVGNESKWKYPPFSAKITGNRLYGRGAFDMKSSLAAMVFAMKALSGLDLRGNLIFTAVVDEEPGAYSEIGAKYLLKQGLRGDVCIVGEPKMDKICIGCKGGYRFKIIVSGESCHTGVLGWEKKTKGINAVLKMAKILLALENLRLKYKPNEFFQARKPIITPGTMIKGGTGINIVPDYCEASVDIRLMPGQNKKQVKQEILDCIKSVKKSDPEIRARIKDLAFVPSVFIPPDEKIVKILRENASRVLKRTVKPGTTGTWCDAHFFIAKGILTISGFGPDGGNLHGLNEFVRVKSVIQASKIYALTAFDFLR